MQPFKKNPKKKAMQLRKADFNMKDYFSNMISSTPDIMRVRLLQMLNAHTESLHAFVELGGLSKIYQYLLRYYEQHNEAEMIKWLQILNHAHFPIDIELIRNLGLGPLIIKNIKHRWKDSNAELATLTKSIEQNWFEFAKQEKQELLSRSHRQCKKVSIASDDLCRSEIRFQKDDTVTQLLLRGQSPTYDHDPQSDNTSALKSILTRKTQNESSAHTRHSNPECNKSNDSWPWTDEAHMDNKEPEYTLEYVDMDEVDNDVDMHGQFNQSTDDDGEEDGDEDEDESDNYMNRMMFTRSRELSTEKKTDRESENELVQQPMEWYRPIPLTHIDSHDTACDTDAARTEENRIRYIPYNVHSYCIQLESSQAMNVNVHSIVNIVLDYPHWSEIQEYRETHDV